MGQHTFAPSGVPVDAGGAVSGLCEPVVNVSMLVELFNHRHPVTVYRWTGDGPGKVFPEPDLTLGGGVKVWKVETVLSWAAANNEQVNSGVLNDILLAQTS